MSQAGEGHHEDFMRAFFRLRVGDLGKLLPFVMDITRKSLSDGAHNSPAVLTEANGILLVRSNEN